MDQFPVIALCGPSKSGKGLIAEWFEKKGFVDVAFADPFKRFLKPVFNYEDRDLWGSLENKERQISYEVDDWLTIISACAKKANAFINDVIPAGHRITAYTRLMEWIHQMRNLHDSRTVDGKIGYITPREIMQTFGTEYGRAIDKLLWANYFFQVVSPKIQDGGFYTKTEGVISSGSRSMVQGIIISDERFLNEHRCTEAAGGYNVRIRRLSMVSENQISNVGIQGHSSEVELRNIPDSAFDLVIETQEGIEIVHDQLEEIFKEKAWELKRKASSSTSSPPSDPPSAA